MPTLSHFRTWATESTKVTGTATRAARKRIPRARRSATWAALRCGTSSTIGTACGIGASPRRARNGELTLACLTTTSGRESLTPRPVAASASIVVGSGLRRSRTRIDSENWSTERAVARCSRRRTQYCTK